MKNFKKHLPTKESFQKNRLFRFLGERVFKPELWHFNRRSVAKAFAIAFFWLWMPIPLQTVCAAVFALIYRANISLAVGLVFISNPLTIPPMMFLAYKVGSLILNTNQIVVYHGNKIEWVKENIAVNWQPMLFGSVVLALLSSLIAYTTINIIWRLSIVEKYKAKKALKKKEKTKK